ncbi:MAG: PEP-CTERM sorting domain-containing protein [Bryobacteraceae bacterium]
MRSFVLSSLVLLCAGVAAHAVSFKNTANGVWSTGLDASAVVMTGNTADSHYFLIQPAGCSAVPTPANCTGFGPNAITVVGPPGTIWSANDANSAWVGPIGNQSAVQNDTIYNSSVNPYTYRMIVDFAALHLYFNTANISLRVLSDNNVNNVGNPSDQSHIRVCSIGDASNRTPCGITTRVTGSATGAENTNPFSSQAPVNIGPSYFTSALMAIDFVVYNSPIAFGANPSGLRVEILSATADPVPEPMTVSLIGFGLLGLGWMARRK